MKKNIKLQTNKMKFKKKVIVYIKLKKRKLLKNNHSPFLQIHLTEHCNLNCKSCAHFSPIAKEHFVDINILEETYKKSQP